MIRNKALIHFALITSLLLLLYSHLLIQHPTLSYDDEDLVYPLKDVSSFSQYLDKVTSGEILDRQPIRDLSYWIELKVEQATGFRNSQLINLIIFIGCLWILFLVLIQLQKSLNFLKQDLLFPVLYLTALHPVAVPSIAWTASRKHLLSGFFILIATYFLIGFKNATSTKKSKLLGFYIIIFYCLSLYSQPINLLWLGFACCYLFFTNPPDAPITRENLHPRKPLSLLLTSIKKIFQLHFYWLAACIFLALLTTAINWSYYNSDLFISTQGDSSSKILDESFVNILKRFHILGRYFLQLTFPAWASPAPYELFDIRSISGLLLLVASIIFIFRQLKLKSESFNRNSGKNISGDLTGHSEFAGNLTPSKFLLIWSAFIMAPILMMTLRLTHHGGWDTYLFTSLFGFALLLYTFLSFLPTKSDSSFFQKRFDIKKWAYGSILIFFLYKNWSQIQVWGDEDHLWSYSNEIEQTVYIKAALAKKKLSANGVTQEVIQLAEEIQLMNPQSKQLGYLLGRIYYAAPISFEKKRDLFSNAKIDSAWMSYYLAVTYAQENKFPEALKILDEKYHENPKKFVNTFIGSWKVLGENWKKICEKTSAVENCPDRIIWINQYLSTHNKI